MRQRRQLGEPNKRPVERLGMRPAASGKRRVRSRCTNRCHWLLVHQRRVGYRLAGICKARALRHSQLRTRGLARGPARGPVKSLGNTGGGGGDDGKPWHDRRRRHRWTQQKGQRWQGPLRARRKPDTAVAGRVQQWWEGLWLRTRSTFGRRCFGRALYWRRFRVCGLFFSCSLASDNVRLIGWAVMGSLRLRWWGRLGGLDAVGNDSRTLSPFVCEHPGMTTQDRRGAEPATRGVCEPSADRAAEPAGAWPWWVPGGAP